MLLNEEIIAHTQVLLDSYARLVGNELVQRSGDIADEAAQLFAAPFVVVSHGTQVDPVLNYGNQTALDLWEMSWEQLTQTPSRKTAEPMHRDERAQMLAQGRKRGYIDNYQGIRISSTGRRFQIHRAIIWNLTDESGQAVGQAATFSDWDFLNDSPY
ncbi:MAG: MEKHLA domain-containing protein [Planctomycetaceae bacterium]|nr:MEKHLA domain-containing protein [Planctomycetaceae bacterium]